MRTRIIQYCATVAREFHDDQPVGLVYSGDIGVTFEWDEKSDLTTTAYKALADCIAQQYPGMEFQIEYWDWLN